MVEQKIPSSQPGSNRIRRGSQRASFISLRLSHPSVSRSGGLTAKPFLTLGKQRWIPQRKQVQRSWSHQNQKTYLFPLETDILLYCYSIFAFMTQVFQERLFVTFQHLGIERRFHACQASALLHPITSQLMCLLVSVRMIYLHSPLGINYMWTKVRFVAYYDGLTNPFIIYIL